MKCLIGTVYILTIFLLTGCHLVGTVTDFVPKGVPKGYVEFYTKAPALRCYHNISVIENNEKVFLGKMNNPPFVGSKLIRRVAMPPGEYTFFVGCGTASNEVKVKIVEDMLTLVLVETYITGSSGNMMYFNMNSRIIERLIPVGLDSNGQLDKIIDDCINGKCP